MTSFICLWLFVIAIAVTSSEPNMGRPCRPGEQGELPGVQYYYHRDRNKLYPFYYHGCGGTDERNRFISVAYGRQHIILDRHQCVGFVRSTGVCHSIDEPERACPRGSTCNYARPEGMCCPDDVAARYRKNRRAKCKGGKRAVKTGNEVLFGRECDHGFCPTGSDCVQGEFEAYCCNK